MLAPLFFVLQSTNVHTSTQLNIYLRCLIFLWPRVHTTCQWFVFYFSSLSRRLDRHVYSLCSGIVVIIIINSARQMFGWKIIITRHWFRNPDKSKNRIPLPKAYSQLQSNDFRACRSINPKNVLMYHICL